MKRFSVLWYRYAEFIIIIITFHFFGKILKRNYYYLLIMSGRDRPKIIIVFTSLRSTNSQTNIVKKRKNGLQLTAFLYYYVSKLIYYITVYCHCHCSEIKLSFYFNIFLLNSILFLYFS